MLILTRRVGEIIMIGETIRITIVAVKGSHVSLGFEAPKDVPVFREEVYERIKAERDQFPPT